jgi:hypothetical protein
LFVPTAVAMSSLDGLGNSTLSHTAC